MQLGFLGLVLLVAIANTFEGNRYAHGLVFLGLFVAWFPLTCDFISDPCDGLAALLDGNATVWPCSVCGWDPVTLYSPDTKNGSDVCAVAGGEEGGCRS